MKDYNKPLSFLQKIGYGVGDAGSNLCWSFIATFIMIYCTNTLGVSAAAVGTLMMLSKILDGVSDVLMGRIIDATHHRMGKARFWYFVSCFPTALFTFVIFNIPAAIPDTHKYIWFFIVYTLTGAVFYTMNNIAYASMTALCTKNPKDRVDMGSYRFIFAIISVLVMSSVTMGLVEKFGGGQQGWRTVSLIYAILCLILLLIPVFAVKELPEEAFADEKKEDAGEKLGFMQSIRILLKSKYFLLILVLYLAMYLSSGITSGMGVYFATYRLGNAALLGTLSMAGMLPLIVVLPFISKLIEKMSMQRAAILGHVIGSIGGILILVGGLMASFPMILVGIVVKAAGSAPQTGALNALIAEIDENVAMKTGHKITGTIYSCSSVGIKVGTGIGTAVCGFLLDMSGFNGLVETQTAQAITTINWSFLLGHAFLPILSVVIFLFMNVEKENRKLREG